MADIEEFKAMLLVLTEQGEIFNMADAGGPMPEVPYRHRDSPVPRQINETERGRVQASTFACTSKNVPVHAFSSASEQERLES